MLDRDARELEADEWVDLCGDVFAQIVQVQSGGATAVVQLLMQTGAGFERLGYVSIETTWLDRREPEDTVGPEPDGYRIAEGGRIVPTSR